MSVAGDMNDAEKSEPSGQEAFEKRRRKRSVAIALALGLMAVMFFTSTIVQLKGQVGVDRFKSIKQPNVKRVQ